MSLALALLSVITFLWVLVVFRYSYMKIPHVLRLFLGGMLLFGILNAFLYSIGKTLSADLFFFEIRISGKNGLADFERQYKNFIDTIGNVSPIVYGIWFLIAPACIEEIGKLFILIQGEQKRPRLRNTADAVYSMVFIAMGFAFLETITYLISSYRLGTEWGDLSRLALFRAILSTASHVVFSGIIGFFYGRVQFAGFSIIDHGGITRFNKILKWIKKIRFIPISSIKTLYQAQLLLVSFSIAIPLHIAYNYSLHLGNIPLAYFLIVGSGGLFYWYTLDLEAKECNYLEVDKRIAYLASLRQRVRTNQVRTDTQKRLDDLKASSLIPPHQ